MSNIFYGLIFLFFDFTINIGPISLGLVPNFVGYIFIVMGLGELMAGSQCFEKARPWAVVMAIYTSIEYILGLFGVMSLLQPLKFASNTICFAIDVYIVYMIIRGIQELEKLHYADYNSANLKSIWVVQIILQAISLAITWLTVPLGLTDVLGVFSIFTLIEIPLFIAIVVVHILFLVKFYNTKKMMEFAKVILDAKQRQEDRR